MLLAVEKGCRFPEQAFDGRIHSVFSHAINIISNDSKTKKWVSILDLSLPNTPCGLSVSLTSEPLFSQCQVGDKVYLRGGILRFSTDARLSVDSRSAIKWKYPPQVNEYSLSQLKNNIHHIENHFIKYVNNRINPKLHVTTYSDYLNYIAIDFDFDLVSKPESIVDNLGRGQGLTPSGDDFICGVLALLNYVTQYLGSSRCSYRIVQERIANACSVQWHKTTDVSRHYLQQACEGDFSQPVTWLVYSIFNSTCFNEVEEIINDVLEIGSSSGIDIVSGILFGAHFLQQNID
ncbi:DUF2877 domain-containing protein [Vibrio pacinii]|uniref:DUF2877 domain-containing protein n=1 Tax=Vibrio pacinii TaxID=170674 RepID=UPI000571EB8C|nr:DUF2877 domain-containing protein [Vibrio pacinii]